MQRVVVRVLTALGILLFLALASFLTTRHFANGSFPAGEFQVTVLDPESAPVPGAVLHVYQGTTRRPALDFPIVNYKGEGIVADARGRTTLHFPRRKGFQFGGMRWYLFWVVEMGARVPEFTCEVTAEGFEPQRFSIWWLDRTAERPPRTKDGQPPARTATIWLERSKDG